MNNPPTPTAAAREAVAVLAYSWDPYLHHDDTMPIYEAREVSWEDAPEWHRNRAFERADAILALSPASTVAEERAGEGRALVPIERLKQFEDALLDLRWAAERVLGGQQFNAYDSASNDDDDLAEDCDMIIAIGPISDARIIGECTGRDQGRIIEAALKFASEAMLALSAPDASLIQQAEGESPTSKENDHG